MEQTKKINRFRRLGLPLLLLVALLASLAWTWLAIQPLPAQVPVQEQFLNFTPDYTITATQSLSIWPAGTTLEQGRVGYFYTARPVVDLKPLVSVSGLDQGQVLRAQIRDRAGRCADQHIRQVIPCLGQGEADRLQG